MGIPKPKVWDVLNEQIDFKSYLEKDGFKLTYKDHKEVGVSYTINYCPLCHRGDCLTYYTKGYEENPTETWSMSEECFNAWKEADEKNKGFYKKYFTPQDFLYIVKGKSSRASINTLQKVVNEQQEQQQELEQVTPPYEVSQKGTPLRIWENLKLLYDDKGFTLKFNELSKVIEVQGIEFYQYSDFITKVNTDSRRTGLNLSKDDLWEFSECIANDNAFNPITQYLEECHAKYTKEAPKTSYVRQLLDTITYTDNTSEHDIAFNELCLIKWLLSGIHIAYNNGHNNVEFSPVFKGPQGCGKTRWFRALMPKVHVNEFFKEGAQIDLSKTDDKRQATGVWLCELGELGATMKKSDRDALKAWLTAIIDEYRTPYAREARKYFRRTFFACTVNDDEFFRDDTGNRRFVVMEVEKTIYNHTIDVDMLWGELMKLYKEDTIPLYLTQEEQEYNNIRNKAHIIKASEQIYLEEYLPLEQPQEEWGYITSAQVCEFLFQEHGIKLDVKRTGKALNGMGFKQEKKYFNGKQSRYYKMPFLKNYSVPF